MQGIRDAIGRLAPLNSAVLTALALVCSATSAEAQSIQTLVLQGETIPGAPGTLSSVLDVAVNDSGEWIARVAMTTSSGGREAAILNGAAVLNNGDDLFDPPGLKVESFDDLDLGFDGTLWWNIETNASGTVDEVMYRNLTLLAREGDPVFDPNQAAGTVWKDFDGFNLNAAGELLILGDVDSPAISGTSEAVLVLQTMDALGNLATEQTLLMEGDTIPGSFDEIIDVGTNSGAHDVAHSVGNWIAYVRGDGGSSKDETIYFNGDVIAKEGATGPLVGTIWGRLASNAVDVNENGDFVHRGEYNVIGGDTFDAIFKNGLPLLQSGDTSPFLAPYALKEFGNNTPVYIGDNGNVVYYGKNDNANTSQDEAYFLNDRYLVQENISPVGSTVIGNLVTGPNGLAISPGGRYVIFEAFLSDGTNGIFLIDLGLIEVMESCATTPGTLAHVDGIPLLGETLTMQMDGEQDFGMTPVFMVSGDPVVGWPPCGLMTPFGELLIDVSAGNGNPAVVEIGPPSDFLPVDFTVTVPNDTALLNRDFYAQGFWWDIGDQSTAENFRLTNGMKVSLAPR